MAYSQDQLKALLERYVNGETDADETRQFLAALREEQHAGVLDEFMQREWGEAKQGEQLPANWEGIWKKIEPSEVKRFNWRRLAVAASILVVLAMGFLLLRKQPTRDPEEIATNHNQDVSAPDRNRARIQLANGDVLYLDSLGNGTVATDAGMRLIKRGNGDIAYEGSSSTNIQQPSVNTLSNPRGSNVIHITLGDGSRVWLNAGSSISYPVSFVQADRRVEVNGEAYFEVAHDARKPFIVSKDETSVTVLGTHFNVNAYGDEDAIRVTLLEGSVEVKAKSGIKKIAPGEQAVVTDQLPITVRQADISETMAWKNGTFSFDNSDIKTILRQFSRWYDVDVVYEKDPGNRQFFGIVKRSSTLSQVLQILKANDIRFEINGRKLILK